MASSVQFNIVFSRLRLIWVVCFGMPMLLIAASLVLSHIWIPYIAFLCMGAIIYMGNYNLNHSSVNCSMITHYSVYILLISGLVMLTLNLMNTNMMTNQFSQFRHTEMPFHVSLIIFPVSAIMYGIALLRRGKTKYCKACKQMAGFSIVESLRRNVMHNESKMQLWMAFGISLLLAIAVWLYYLLFYVKTTFKGPDRFILYYIPLLIYGVSVVYILMRYSNMQFEIQLTGVDMSQNRRQLLRFIIIKGDELLLHESASSLEIGLSLWDTPAIVSFDLLHEVSNERAAMLFSNLSDVENANIRRLFMTHSGDQSIIHYAVFLKPDQTTTLPGEWFTLYALDNMIKNGLVTRTFAYEMHRIFTITMTWKTYDRDGRRLYPIKNYRPTFRLRDFSSWNVDYSDLEWLSIAENNEDKPMFKLRKFWREYISGIDKRWRRKDS